MGMLFFEKFVESATGAGRRDGRTSRIAGLAFDRRAGDKVRAFIADILFYDPLGNRLRTFKLRTGIEMTAVLAGSQIRPALRTLAAFGDLYIARNHSAAHGASQHFLKARHLHAARHIAG